MKINEFGRWKAAGISEISQVFWGRRSKLFSRAEQRYLLSGNEAARWLRVENQLWKWKHFKDFCSDPILWKCYIWQLWRKVEGQKVESPKNLSGLAQFFSTRRRCCTAFSSILAEARKPRFKHRNPRQSILRDPKRLPNVTRFLVFPLFVPFGKSGQIQAASARRSQSIGRAAAEHQKLKVSMGKIRKK